MAGNKKYFWLKLKDNFFKRHEIRIIEELPNGKDYVLFYLKLLVESISHEGKLRFSETIPYDEKMLSVISNTNVDIVRSAIKIFRELNMVEVYDDGTFFMNEVNKMIGSETKWADKKRKYRENQALLGQCPPDVPSMSDKSIEIEKEIELEIDTESDTEIEKDIETETDVKKENNKKKKGQKHRYGEYENVLLTDYEVMKLEDYLGVDYDDMIQEFSEGIAMKDYKYNSHYLAIRNWYKNRMNGRVQKIQSPGASRMEKSINVLRAFAMED